jgi:hypothetical protein
MEKLTKENPPVHFLDAHSDGFYFDKDFKIQWPPSYQSLVDASPADVSGRRVLTPAPFVAVPKHAPSNNGAETHPLNPLSFEDAYLPMSQHLLQNSSLYFRPGTFRPTADELAASEAVSRAAA